MSSSTLRERFRTSFRAAAALALASACAAPPAAQRDARGDLRGAEAVVRELYDRLTFEAGTTPDWDAVRALFDAEAVVVLRTGREQMTVFTLEGWVQDFVDYIEQHDVLRTGLTERLVELDGFAYRDIAHVRVLFESFIPGSERPPGAGLDVFELLREDGRWRIVGIVNERPTQAEPIPAGLFREFAR